MRRRTPGCELPGRHADRGERDRRSRRGGRPSGRTPAVVAVAAGTGGAPRHSRRSGRAPRDRQGAARPLRTGRAVLRRRPFRRPVRQHPARPVNRNAATPSSAEIGSLTGSRAGRRHTRGSRAVETAFAHRRRRRVAKGVDVCPRVLGVGVYLDAFPAARCWARRGPAGGSSRNGARRGGHGNATTRRTPRRERRRRSRCPRSSNTPSITLHTHHSSAPPPAAQDSYQMLTFSARPGAQGRPGSPTRAGFPRSRPDNTGSATPQSAPMPGSSQATPSSSVLVVVGVNEVRERHVRQRRGAVRDPGWDEHPSFVCPEVDELERTLGRRTEAQVVEHDARRRASAPVVGLVQVVMEADDGALGLVRPVRLDDFASQRNHDRRYVSTKPPRSSPWTRGATWMTSRMIFDSTISATLFLSLAGPQGYARQSGAPDRATTRRPAPSPGSGERQLPAGQPHEDPLVDERVGYVPGACGTRSGKPATRARSAGAIGPAHAARTSPPRPCWSDPSIRDCRVVTRAEPTAGSGPPPGSFRQAQAPTARTGQVAQTGARAVQTRLPKSITARFHSRPEPPGARRSAKACASRGRSGRPAAARARTRPTFVSTAATSASNANASTARAVHGPTPGRATSSSRVAGDASPVALHDRRGGRVQRQGAPVVTQPRPRPDDVTHGRGGARGCGGETRDELTKARRDAGDPGFGQASSRRRAPPTDPGVVRHGSRSLAARAPAHQRPTVSTSRASRPAERRRDRSRRGDRRRQSRGARGRERQDPVPLGLAVDREPPGESGRRRDRQRAEVERQRDVDRASFGHRLGTRHLEVAADLDRLGSVGRLADDRLPVLVDQEQLPVVQPIDLGPVDVDLDGHSRRVGPPDEAPPAPGDGELAVRHLGGIAKEQRHPHRGSP